MASTTVRTFRTTPRRLDCAEVFFKCLETFGVDGYGGMADSIRNCVYDPAYANPGSESYAAHEAAAGVYWIENGATPAKSVYPLVSVTSRLRDGTWPNFAQRKVITFATGIQRFAALARVPFGNGSNLVPGQDGNISIALSAGHFHAVVRSENEGLLAADSTSTVTGNSLNGSYVNFIGEYIPATTDGVTVTNGSFRMRIIDLNGNTLMADDAVTPLDMTLVVDTVGDVRSDIRSVTRFGGIDFYSIMAFSFSGDLPAESVRESAYKWMRRHHAAEHRELPPQFVGYI